MVLAVGDLTLEFSGLRALTGVSMSVAAGALAALVGPNGAGKTCLLNCVGGFYAPTSGRIVFGDTAIQGQPSHRIAAHGIARTFQFVELFRGMTVLDNILLGRHRHMRAGVLAGGLFWGRSRREETLHRRRVDHRSRWGLLFVRSVRRLFRVVRREIDREALDSVDLGQFAVESAHLAVIMGLERRALLPQLPLGLLDVVPGKLPHGANLN